ncbi:Bug family tripartite tricarboxylate transporter substrate binding protein [Ramlibacter rhizophilus]|uniref:Tripartite tricarboxylate transporter substrate binding protein n=1 Tax=Ramlibacter rhizophilus TaxID=1781167 RepID=A0A4Z0BGL9_9BURK|nr:tripartite tricarboxylate transporter substrate binding protein [Ramlibacter rhizophilus]TFY97417.1 tripartite tricarboxylate transporter substrate binding protein [Ramlibacter rhizophilus]
MPDLHRSRRALVRLAAALPIALCAWGAAAQSSFPSQPIRFIVPYAAGGPADAIARSLQPKLQENLGQPVIIENKPGGYSNIGHEMVSKATPDGHTIVYVVPNVVTNPLLYNNMVDPVKDLAPVSQLTSQAYLMVARPDFPAKTLPQIIERAKKQGVNCASGGGLPAFGCMWLKSHTKADFTHIQFKGNAPAMNNLLGGQVDLLIDLYNTALPQVKAGKVQPIAITASKRGMPLPDLPVINETIPGFVLEGWHGVMAPPGTPAPVLDRLSQAFRAALKDPAVAERLNASFIEPSPSTPAEFGKVIKDDWAKYSRITREAGIKPE